MLSHVVGSRRQAEEFLQRGVPARVYARRARDRCSAGAMPRAVSTDALTALGVARDEAVLPRVIPRPTLPAVTRPKPSRVRAEAVARNDVDGQPRLVLAVARGARLPSASARLPLVAPGARGRALRRRTSGVARDRDLARPRIGRGPHAISVRALRERSASAILERSHVLRHDEIPGAVVDADREGRCLLTTTHSRSDPTARRTARFRMPPLRGRRSPPPIAAMTAASSPEGEGRGDGGIVARGGGRRNGCELTGRRGNGGRALEHGRRFDGGALGPRRRRRGEAGADTAAGSRRSARAAS